MRRRLALALVALTFAGGVAVVTDTRPASACNGNNC